MNISGFIWLEDIVQKLKWKHSVTTEEARGLFEGELKFRFIEKGHRKGENVYAAPGKTDKGRYLICFFVHKHRQSGINFIGERHDRFGEKKIW